MLRPTIECNMWRCVVIICVMRGLPLGGRAMRQAADQRSSLVSLGASLLALEVLLSIYPRAHTVTIACDIRSIYTTIFVRVWYSYPLFKPNCVDAFHTKWIAM